jgi:gliding motility-associated-like protein
LDISTSFTHEFEVNFGTKADPAGADGLTWILSTSPKTADNSAGHLLGVRDLSPSIHVELDAFQNIAVGEDMNDPAVSHLAVFKNGKSDHEDAANCLTKKPTNGGWIQLHPTKTNIQDGSWYSIRIEYRRSSQKLAIYVDGSLRETISIDIQNDIFNGKKSVYWGITGSTGGSSNLQQVRMVEDSTTNPTPILNGYRAPNVFSPNGDGVNDYFFIKTSGNTEVEEIRIYSRNGQLIYSGANLWNGKFNGSTVVPGTYFFVATIKEPGLDPEHVKGSITVVR